VQRLDRRGSKCATRIIRFRIGFGFGGLGRRVGASTGTNLWGAFGLLAEMVADGRSGSVVTLLADSGDPYADTYFCDEWLKTQELDTSAPATALTEFERSGHWD
jgi:cysteine synthase